MTQYRPERTTEAEKSFVRAEATVDEALEQAMQHRAAMREHFRAMGNAGADLAILATFGADTRDMLGRDWLEIKAKRGNDDGK